MEKDVEFGADPALVNRAQGRGPAGFDRGERFYVDCEFDGHGGPLLSIALVHEGGCSIHVSTDQRPADPWVQQNVMPIMSSHNAAVESVNVPVNLVGTILRGWMGSLDHPVFVADSPVDIGRVCHALSTGEDGGWASAEYPRMSFEVHNVDCYPTDLPGAVQHNAWWDAMALQAKLSQGTEAGTAKTVEQGLVHDGPVAESDAPKDIPHVKQ